MNPTGDQQQQQPHRPSTSCDSHPDEQFSGFCPSCLCERLSVLDNPTNNNASKPVSSTLRAFSNAFFPELRRTKSFSASKTQGFSGVFEPQRKSCDVRGRNTLRSLFNLGEIEAQTSNLGASSTTCLGPAESHTLSQSDHMSTIEDGEQEIIEEEEEQEKEVKTMKDHMGLDSQMKKPSGRDFKDIAGSFLSAASVFSKKLQKWRQKQKLKKRINGGGSATLPVEKPMGRQYRETQSEIADYGFGRRSCDIDPRFSLDAGRISFDDPRYSIDEPRASWDGYLVGRTTFPRMPTMLSVVEDAPVHVLRSDNLIPLEEPPRISVNEDEMIPGGTEQTRDYYSSDSSSRRRKSLDRSSSVRKTAAAIGAEIDEMKYISNSKVSPAAINHVNGPNLVVPDRDLMKVHNSNSLRDDCSESWLRDNASVAGNGEVKGSSRKSRRWSIWSFIHRKGSNRDVDEDGFSRVNGVERSLSESWQEFRGERNGNTRGAFNPKVFRSNSSFSWRNSNNFAGTFGNIRHNSAEGNGHGKKARDEIVLERNHSARYSSNNIDNGPLRFYLAPNGSSRRGGSWISRSSHAHSTARTMLRLY